MNLVHLEMSGMCYMKILMAKMIHGEPGCILQYNRYDEIIANVLDFILEKICDFRVTAKTHRLFMFIIG